MDIKFKNHFWPKPNLTKKIEFVSKDVQIVEPETFGLLIFFKLYITRQPKYETNRSFNPSQPETRK